jgi:non-specific serine/threonine protein kinase
MSGFKAVVSRDHGFACEVTSFVGRRKEVAEIKSLLSSSRLVTLTGVGGVGKTRLAARAATELRRAYADGIWLIELAEISDQELVGLEVAAALGLRSASAENAEQALLDFVADKRMLIVLDNCEHLLEVCGTLASRIVRSARGVQILATSREALGVFGETAFEVPPLSLFNAAAAPGEEVPSVRSEAVELFEERASSAVPELSLDEEGRRAVAALCQRLDGLPLAIELAAVRIRSFSAGQLLAREGALFDLLTRGNRGGPVRHQTLRGAIDWSFNLCSPQEQVLWARLSVFTGGFDLNAAQGVCTDGSIATKDVLEIIAGLVDKSIISKQEHGSQVRYRMLESIKDYGLDRLREQDDEQAWRRRHRDYYLQATELSERESGSRKQVEWCDRLQFQRANLRSALTYCLSTPGEYHAGLRMAASLWFFWNACGYLRDGRRWLARALEMNPEPCHERAKALWAIGWYAMVQGDTQSAYRYLHECSDLAESINDEPARAFALQFRGTTEQIAGNVSAALKFLNSAASYHRAANRADCLSILCHAQLAFAYCVCGEFERALEICDHGLAAGEPDGELFSTSWILWVQGLTLWFQRHFDKAREALNHAIELKQVLHDWLGIATCTEVLTWIAIEEGEPERSACLFGIGYKLCGEVESLPLFGSPVLVSTRAKYEQKAREQLGHVVFERLTRAGEQLEHADAIALALRKPADSAVRKGVPGGEIRLTRRELQVARLVTEGLTNKEIAEKLVISQRTAEGHINRILAKTGHRSRTQFAAWITRNQAIQQATATQQA